MKAEPQAAVSIKRQRRRFQFSLRTLLIAVTLLAALSAAVVWVVRDRDRLFQERDRLIQERDRLMQERNYLDGVDSAKTVEEIKTSVPFATIWKETTFANRKYLFATREMGDGESYIDLHGWIYNRHFKEWRRILKIKTRSLGSAKLLIDDQKGTVSLRGAANDEFRDVEVFRFGLRVTSDDRAYDE